MFKQSAQWSAVLVAITALVLICIQSLGAKPALSETPGLQSLEPIHIATATAPPRLIPAVLGGKPVHVLYVTRSEDTIIVRCYPGYAPTLTLRNMGSSSNTSPQQEGVMTCRSAA